MRRARTTLTMILIAALLCVRLAGPHWHLCFDGTEPPAALQLQGHEFTTDLGTDPKSSTKPKQDFDIDLLGQLMAKFAKASLDNPVFILAVIVLMLMPPIMAIRRAPAPNPWRPPNRSGIRPPLRAPPR